MSPTLTKEIDMTTHYARFYGDMTPDATVSEVEEAILSTHIDPDGISCYEWAKAICTDDVPLEMIQYIIRNQRDPSVEPLYQIVRTMISDIIDKE